MLCETLHDAAFPKYKQKWTLTECAIFVGPWLYESQPAYPPNPPWVKGTVKGRMNRWVPIQKAYMEPRGCIRAM